MRQMIIIRRQSRRTSDVGAVATKIDSGELAEWSKAAVLKTVEGQPSGGSNPSLSARQSLN